MAARVFRWVGGLVAAIVLAAALVAYLQQSTGGARDSGSTSMSAGGWRGALLLLESYGHRVISWRQAPASLAELDTLLFVHDARMSSFASVLQDAADGDDDASSDYDEWMESVVHDETRSARSEVDPRHLSHYRAYFDAGGRALVGLEAEEWLTEGVGLEFSAARFPSPDPASPLSTPAGEELVADFDHEARLPRRVDRVSGEVLLADASGAPFAALYELSGGSLVLVTDASIWRNEELRELDHAFLLVSLVGLVGGDRTVLFDDFAIGVHEPHGLMHMMFVGRGAPLGWSLALLILFVFAAVAPARRFPRDPAAASEVNPYLRVLSLANLYDRARSRKAVGSRLRHAVIGRLRERLRVREWDPEAVIHAAANRAPDEATAREWASTLSTDPAGGYDDLERRADGWREIERAVERSLRRETREGVGPRPRKTHG